MTASQFLVEDKEQRQHAFERLGLALQRSFDSFERQLNFVTLTRLILGPMLGQPELEEYLSSNLDLQVISLDLSTVVNLASVKGMNEPAMQAKCFHAIGAALRDRGG
jgi:hypothetical protein